MEKLKMRCLLLAFMLSTMVIGFSAKADVVLNATNFPDANFRAYITTITGVATGDTITQQKLNSITSMYCSSKSIASLKGIEYFTALTTLYCYNNSLTTLDLSHNTALKTLSCSNNQLTELDMTNNAALTKLYCNSNQLTSLDVTHNTKLTTLDCYTNQLPALDVTHNTALTSLSCYGNPLQTLDVTKNTALVSLDCSKDQLTALDLSHNAALTTLNCSNNQLAALSLSNNANLTQFKEYSNSRTIKVYSYTKPIADGGGTGYYVPLAAQAATTINGVSYGATKALATLIGEAGQGDDPAFDLTKVVSGTWGGATLGTVNGAQVLLLDTAAKAITYRYDTGFTGTCTNWQAYANNDKTTVTAPNAYFTLNWQLADVVTSVDGVESSDVNVYTTLGAINISGSFNGDVNVYNLRGQQVYCGRDSEIAVPVGMYLVNVDGAVHKVLVK
jgi:hypothetical protein